MDRCKRCEIQILGFAPFPHPFWHSFWHTPPSNERTFPRIVQWIAELLNRQWPEQQAALQRPQICSSSTLHRHRTVPGTGTPFGALRGRCTSTWGAGCPPG